MPLLASDPLELMLACAEGTLNNVQVKWNEKNYVGVVMVSGGYPEEYQTGFKIAGLEEEGPEDTMVFHAGTKLGDGGVAGQPLTVGGRVLTVVGGGDNMEQARERAYARLELISFEGAAWRRDIGSAANQGSARSTG
jgi:phosphoribosylamine--glycine ligase